MNNTTPTPEAIVQETLDSINSLVEAFRREPYTFLYESDLQAWLTGDLRKRIPYRLSIKRSNTQTPPYELGLVYSEYGGKIDIVCLDPKKSQTSDMSPYKGFDTYIYNLPILVGIELKYRKMGDSFKVTQIMADLAKLESYPEIPNPLAIGFVQDESDVDDFLASLPPLHHPQKETKITKAGFVYVVTPRDTFAIHPNEE